MPTVHFTIGEDLGIRLAEIAKEKLQSFDLERALSIWTDAFGCPDDLAKKLTATQMVVTVDDPVKCIVGVCNRDELDKERQNDYPVVSEDWLHNIIDREFQDYTDLQEGHVFYDLRAQMSAVRRLITENVPLDVDSELTGIVADAIPVGVSIHGTVTVKPRTVMKAVVNREPDEYESDLEKFVGDLEDYTKNIDMVKLHKIIWVTRQMMEISKKAEGMLKISQFCEEMYGSDKFYGRELQRRIDTVLQFLNEMSVFTQDESGATVAEVIQDPIDSELDRYIKGVKNIDRLDDGFGPVNIEDGYDAGWIAPDGNYFGLNGSSGNFLHCALAEKIMEYYDFKKPDDFNYSIDAFIASKGFVKVHHDWVLYEGYDCMLTDKPVPLTKEQIDKIYRYGQIVHGGKLFFGYDKEFCSAVRFKDCDDSYREKLLKIN